LPSLSDVASGTPVLVRGDVDAKVGPKVGDGDVRLRSMTETLRFGHQRGWKQIVFGHIGRKPEGTLKAVASRLEELLSTPVKLVVDWLDEPSLTIRQELVDEIRQSDPGCILLLENTRRYDIERALWKAKPADVERLAEPLARLASEFGEKVAQVYVNEALSAGSLDASSTVVPAGMQRVALGAYVAAEFDGPMQRCLDTQLVVFSGLKTDKLDDLEAMIARGSIRWVIAAGSLAMALKRAAGELDGQPFAMGVAGDPEHRDKPYFIAQERVAQARRMIEAGRAEGIQFVLPVDFVLADGRTASELGPADQQLDVGPESSKLFEQTVTEFITTAKANPDQESSPVAFYNGVFGKFEDPQFELGTKRFIAQLKRMTDAGVEVYVGGGEGGAALLRYGQSDWVTHSFTAGGTVLNALGGQPIPYLQALYMAANR